MPVYKFRMDQPYAKLRFLTSLLDALMEQTRIEQPKEITNRVLPDEI